MSYEILKFVLRNLHYPGYFIESIIKIIFYALNNYNNFSYTQLCFLFLLRKDFYICPWSFLFFFLFLLQKEFGIFLMLLFENFLCFLTIFIYLYEKNYENILIVINCFHICIQKNLQIF